MIHDRVVGLCDVILEAKESIRGARTELGRSIILWMLFDICPWKDRRVLDSLGWGGKWVDTLRKRVNEYFDEKEITAYS